MREVKRDKFTTRTYLRGTSISHMFFTRVGTIFICPLHVPIVHLNNRLFFVGFFFDNTQAKVKILSSIVLNLTSNQCPVPCLGNTGSATALGYRFVFLCIFLLVIKTRDKDQPMFYVPQINVWPGQPRPYVVMRQS